ncbi:MAG: ABC transporter permease [Anaerolineales bacterium]
MNQTTQSLEKQETEQLTVIQPSRGWAWIDLRELWRYRELVYFLVWRDVKVRYKQTLLGAAWAILRPFLSMVIFTVVFAGLANLDTDGAPPPVFYFSGLLPWMLFQDGVVKAGNSLVTGSSLITKVYFPRIAIPLASVLAGVVDFALAFIVLVGMMIYYGVRPTDAIWTLPLFLLLALVTSLGVGLWLSALNVQYRDVGYVTPFLLQAWMFASPVVYSATLIPEGWARIAFGLNPMAGVVQGFRWAILGVGEPPSELIILSVLVAIFLLISGMLYFKRMERTFADVV